MKHLIAAALILFAVNARATDPVVVPHASSPDGAFLIRLTHDRIEGPYDPFFSVPNVEILSAQSKKILASFVYPTDVESDAQPLRWKIRAHWNDDCSAVALSFSERFLTDLVVYRLKGPSSEPEAFIAVTLPDTRPIIQAMIPRFSEFRSRWHHHIQGWSSRYTIQFSAGTGALITPLADEDPNFMASYSFTVDISDEKTPVINRVEHLKED